MHPPSESGFKSRCTGDDFFFLVINRECCLSAKPSVSIQLHSQPASASNFRLTQGSSRVTLAPRRPPADDDFPALPRDDHPSLGAATAQPPKVHAARRLLGYYIVPRLVKNATPPDQSCCRKLENQVHSDQLKANSRTKQSYHHPKHLVKPLFTACIVSD